MGVTHQAKVRAWGRKDNGGAVLWLFRDLHPEELSLDQTAMGAENCYEAGQRTEVGAGVLWRDPGLAVRIFVTRA